MYPFGCFFCNQQVRVTEQSIVLNLEVEMSMRILEDLLRLHGRKYGRFSSANYLT